MKNVIFDFGGVLITFKPLLFLQELINDTEKAQKCYQLILHSPEWNQMDRGNLCVEEAKQRFIQREPQFKSEINTFFEHWDEMFHPIQGTVDILDDLQSKDIQLFAISNFIEEMWDILYPRFSFFHYFKGIVLSYRIHSAKPDRFIYEYCLKQYNLKPEECLFVDDMQSNVTGAQEAGLCAVQFQSSQQLRNSLKQFSVL